MERRILVVEDSPTQAEHLRLLLQGEGYRVEMARNGREGLDRVRRIRPDLIISDVVMPEMDGSAFCEAVKSDEATRRIPFVLITQKNTALDILMGLERGADNFIPKPFEDHYLLERIERIFEHLEFRVRGRLEVEITLRTGKREIQITADKQQIVELLFSTFEDLCLLNRRLEASQRTVDEYARTLEAKVEERTRQLQEANQTLQTLIHASPLPIFTLDPAGNVQSWNAAAERLFGWAAQKVLGRPHPIVPPESQDEFRAGHNRVLRGKTITGREVRRRRRDGSPIDVVFSAAPLYEATGQVRGSMAIVADITERKRTEEALRQSEKLAAMGSLLAGVAHELNNPLAAIMGEGEFLRAAVGRGPLAARAAKIVDAADRCARIIRNFLALARRRPAARQPTALNQIVREALELVAYPLRVDGVEAALDLAPDIPALWADSHQLHQVVVNLITNAHHAMRETAPPRRLTVATRFDAARGRVSLRVADTGPGIPPDIRERVFEPFFTTKPLDQGTGLGLSLCQGIIEEHGGSIQVESPPGRGATFLVELPVTAAPPAAPEPLAEEDMEPVRGKAILVADDEPAIAELLADLLAMDGHHVDAVENGARALDKLGERAYDLILANIRMPDLDGPGLYREVERRHPHLARRFIFLTGDALTPETRGFLEEPGRTSLGKPFALHEVLRVVQRVLRSA